MKNADLLDYTIDLLNQRRAYYEPQWYINLNGYENNHFVGWNQTSKSIQRYPMKKKFFIQFPEVTKQVDGYQNILLSSNPIYQVYPTDYSDKDQIDQARHQSLFLRQHYLDWHEDNVLHTLVHNSGVMPISFLEIAVQKEWDIEAGEYAWTTVPRVYDAFDIIYDPRYLFEENPCVVKVIRTTNEKIAQSKLYKDFQEQVITSGIQDYKEIYYIDKFGTSSIMQSNRVLIYECHVKDGNDIRIVTIDGAGRVLRESRMKDMPFYSIVPFQPESGFPYQPSLTEKLLPMNRSFDLIANRIESMTLKYVKGSYLMPAGTTVSMSDEDGTLLTYKGAVAPTVLKNPDLPEWAFQTLNFMQTSSDRYGISSQVLGQAPKGSNIRSGKMMDKTTQATILQYKMYSDAFAYTLKRSAEVMVYLESRIMTKPRKFTLQTADQEYQTKSFVGSDYYDAYKSDPNVVPLPKTFKKLTVEIEDESQHGIEAKRATFERFAKLYPELVQTAPELIPVGMSLFLKTGDMDDVMAESMKNGTILQSPAIQSIIENNRAGLYDDNPQFKQAFAIVLQTLAQDPNVEKPKGGMPVTGKPQEPAAKPGNPPQPNQPAPGGQDAGK